MASFFNVFDMYFIIYARMLNHKIPKLFNYHFKLILKFIMFFTDKSVGWGSHPKLHGKLGIRLHRNEQKLSFMEGVTVYLVK